MDRLKPAELFFYFVIGLLFIAFSVLIVFLLKGESTRHGLLTEHEAEKRITDLLESFRGRWISTALEAEKTVLGFGIYNYDGNNVALWGSAPASIAPSDNNSAVSAVTYSKARRSLTLIRRIGFMSGMMRRTSRPMMHGRQNPSYLFLELEASEFWRTQSRYNLASALIPVVMLFVAGLLIILFRRNREYRSRLAAQEQLARLGEVARTLSHEIKNPLGAIKIQTGYLKKVLPPESGAELTIIEEEVGRLDLLTRRIGDFLRDPKGRQEMIGLDVFFRELPKRFDYEFDFHNLCDKAVAVKFDRERLRSVVENLIKNAIESLAFGGLEQPAQIGETAPPIEVRLTQDRTSITIAILDRGAGFPEDAGDRVFDPFFTSKARGSGIGLSIAKRFVESAGARLFLAERNGGGTAATVVLARHKL